ncbi:MAG TPA: hypothetical protein VMB85_07020 [Bryobacteraceae bacterium]|nr:hypothetical protein [Bryobacteraceae bacterium]
MNVPCKICSKRRAKRYCPGVGGDICPVCCGRERENTIDCPLDCEHLMAARQHEQLAPMTPDEVPNKDIRVSEDFVREHEELVVYLSVALAQAMEKERAVDFDAREALGALIRTYRTRESGLIYETRPQNLYAAAIQSALVGSIEEYRKELSEETGMQTLRDAEILGTLVFLERIELQHNNGRRRGRAFFDFLRGSFGQPQTSSVAL